MPPPNETRNVDRVRKRSKLMRKLANVWKKAGPNFVFTFVSVVFEIVLNLLIDLLTSIFFTLSQTLFYFLDFERF